MFVVRGVCCRSVGSVISSVSIRRAVVEDLAAVVPLLAQLSPLWREQDVDEPVTARAEQTWARMLGQDDRLVLVADDGGRVVATLDMVVVAVLIDDIASTAIVMNVVVDHRHRGRGHRHALMDTALRHARNARCGVVELLSSKERAEAHRFYRSLGFEAQAEGFLLRL
jgi:ribosomal protein S18 acetylase RimI-like enzyme